MIQQLSVLLENKKGRLAKLTQTLSDANIDMHALTTADTADFGVIRILCDRPEYAAEILKSHDFSVTLNEVVAFAVPDEVGGLAHVFQLLDQNDIDIEYSYCFTTSTKEAADVLKSATPGVEELLNAAKVHVFVGSDLYVTDESNGVHQ